MSTIVEKSEYSLSFTRPYKNLSPFQYSRGLILILLLLLTPVSNDVPDSGEQIWLLLLKRINKYNRNVAPMDVQVKYLQDFFSVDELF